MDARSVNLVQHSFEKVALSGRAVAEIFYSELFSIDPSLRSMFSTNMVEQHKKLLASLVFVVRSLHTPEAILDQVKMLAVKHVRYGVMPEHYTYVGNALLRTLKKSLGAEFTPEVRQAWVDAYRMLAGVMKQEAYGESRLRGAA